MIPDNPTEAEARAVVAQLDLHLVPVDVPDYVAGNESEVTIDITDLTRCYVKRIRFGPMAEPKPELMVRRTSHII